jgi:hypothetical protein
VFDRGASGVVAAIRGFVERAVKPLQSRIVDLESQLAQLRGISGLDLDVLSTMVKQEVAKHPIPTLRGIWNEDEVYRKGDMAIYGGSVWHAERDPTGRPRETEPNGWRLCVKAGRPGRDGANADISKVLALENAVAALNRRMAKIESGK